ncbi:hypothetical protein BCL90_1506 [Pedobacter alluvionis]|uniref:Uncharacterized protein n=1 Tax=Pedobacter alluvionis TaxID=475253 RepID=A0A497YAV0_9SPHI|nr:hypothetical protein BCL90_1506 [Pedobacter alluvionis]
MGFVRSLGAEERSLSFPELTPNAMRLVLLAQRPLLKTKNPQSL